jgi:putative nucleotidyltransferase with HDIG domain
MNMLAKKDCFRLMREMQMPEHIAAHSIQVCRVALCLAERLQPMGISLNLQLVQAAALLHDITKNRSFETAENHALTGGQQLTALGYPEIGNLVRQHVRLDDYSNPNTLSEAVMINYADKRVLHDRIVSLDERMHYIEERYGTEPEHKVRIRLLWDKTAALEKQIFKYLPFVPDELNRHLGAIDLSKEVERYQGLRPQSSGGSDP